MTETNRIEFKQEFIRIFKDLDMVEQLGSGVPRILEYYDKACFKFSENYLRMTFPVEKEDNTISGGQIGGQIGGAIEIAGQILELTQRQNEVLAIIIKNNRISRRNLAKQLNINESAVLKHIEILKEKGYIERIGGTRGFWKIKMDSNND